MCLCQRTQKCSQRCLSQISHISSAEREKHNNHDFKIYNADIEISGTQINSIDFSACGKGRAGNGDQCLYSVTQGQGLTL